MTRPARAAILAITISLSVAGGCTEPTAVPIPLRNTAPVAHAGRDAMVPLPANAVVLYGSAIDAESNIERYSWQKVFGPDSYSIDSPESMITNVTNLERGWYEFELTVRDKGGLTGKDTVGVLVYEPRVPGVNEIVFRNLEWQCPMGCHLYVGDLRRYGFNTNAISVFLQTSDAARWTEVPPESEWTPQVRYVWAMSEKGMYIFSDDESGAVNVKITF